MAYIRELKVTYERKRVESDLLARSVESPKQVHELFSDMQNETKEKVVVLHLNPQLSILSYEVAAIGNAFDVFIDPVEIYRNAMLARAHSIIVAYNDPSGECKPSSQANDAALGLYRLGGIHNMALQDFIVIGHEKFYSYSEEGKFSTFKQYNKISP